MGKLRQDMYEAWEKSDSYDQCIKVAKEYANQQTAELQDKLKLAVEELDGTRLALIMCNNPDDKDMIKSIEETLTKLTDK